MLAFWTDNKAISAIQVAAIVEIIKFVIALVVPIMLRPKSSKEVANIISRRIDRVLNKTSNKLLLRDLGLTSLPESLQHLSSLQNFQFLNLQDNQIDDLPDWIGEFTNLRSLNIANNKCLMLPTTFWQLTKLQMLDLSDNLISELSESIEKLAKLQTLWLHYNRLRILPRNLDRLTQLQKLFLSEDCFEKSQVERSLAKLPLLKLYMVRSYPP
jgi:Leucine-rich repeat (LRR) protein